MTSRTFYRSVLIQIFREILDPYIGICKGNVRFANVHCTERALIGWLLDRSLAIDAENAHLYIEKLLQIGILTKSALFCLNNVMFIHKNKIPEDPEDDGPYSHERMHDSVNFPFKSDNGIIIVRKSAWQKYPTNHKCRLGMQKPIRLKLEGIKKKLGKKHLSDSAVKLIEKQLYENAGTLHDYLNLKTLSRRIEDILMTNLAQDNYQTKGLEFVHSSKISEELKNFDHSKKMKIVKSCENDGKFRHILLKETHEHYITSVHAKLESYAKQRHLTEENIQLIRKYLDHGMSFEEARKSASKLTRNKFL
jgi:hypothetical protein